MLNFAESGHPVFRASSALEGGELKSKAKGKKFIHFNGSDETIELILSAIISVNQLSVYGAVAALCKELARDSSGAGKPAAHEIWNRWWYRENLLLLTLFLRLMRKNNESCCVNTSRNSQNFLNNRNWWPNSAPTLVFRRILTKGQCFTTLDEEGVDDMKGSCRDQSWMCMSAVIKDVTVLGSWSNLYFETEQFLGFASWTESTNTWPKRQKKFLLQALKTEVQGNLTRTFLHGPMTWKVMQRNVWNDTSNWRTKQLNSSTKSQHRCMDDHQFKEEENGSVGDLSTVCSQIALKCPYVACMWPALGDLIFYGSCTNLLLLAYHSMDQSLWRNVQHVWSHTVITHANSNTIVMWEIQHNSADWDCFKTPILQEILRIQNLHQVEHCAFLEVIRLFQSVGCVRNKLQFRTVQQNRKSSLWTQDWGWTVYPYLIYGIWSSQFFTETRIRVIKNGETRTNFQRERQFMERLMI